MSDAPAIDLAKCREVLQNRAFDVVQPGAYFDQVAGATGERFASVRAAVKRVLFFARGERHVALRKPVVDFFRPAAMLKWQPVIDACVADVIDRLPAEGTIDLMTHYARPVATEILCRMIGFPVAEHEQFDEWTDDVRWLMEPLLPLRQLRRIEAALTPLAHAADQAARSPPDPDLPGTPFLHHPLGGMADEDRIWVAISMYSAGQVTMDTLGNILVEVARAPKEVRDGLLDPERRMAIVDRLIATGGSIAYVSRIAEGETELGGDPVASGTRLELPLADASLHAAAGRCPFAGTWRAGDLAFGNGAHRCVGAFVARLMIASALDALLRRYPHLTLDRPPSGYTRSKFFRTPLDVRCTLA